MGWCYDPLAPLCRWFALPFLFANYRNVRSSVFYLGFCLYCKITQDFAFPVFQHRLLMMRAPPLSIFYFKFLAQKPADLFPTLSWRFLYGFPANCEQEQKICVIISTLFCLAYTGGIYPVCRSHALLILS